MAGARLGQPRGLGVAGACWAGDYSDPLVVPAARGLVAAVAGAFVTGGWHAAQMTDIANGFAADLQSCLERRHHVITRSQALAAGMMWNMLRHRLAGAR